MSVRGGPKIVADGLELYLSSASVKSYPETGTVWYDLSRNNRNGLAIGAPTFVASGIKGFLLNGSTQYVDVYNYTGINFNSSTVIYTARLNASPNARNSTFSKYDGTGPQFEWSSAGNLRSNYRQATAGTPENDAPNASNQVFPNNIYQIAVTYNTGTIAHYKNGVFLGQNTNATQTGINNTIQIGIGLNTSAGLHFKGEIFDVMIYNKLLTPSEIAQNFNAFKTRFYL